MTTLRVTVLQNGALRQGGAELIDEFCLENEKSYSRMKAADRR
jgi:hypothetical protein